MNSLRLATAFVTLAMPGHAEDDTEACRSLAHFVLAQADQNFATLEVPLGIDLAARELAQRTAFLNWSTAPGRADLSALGLTTPQIEVTTCWYPIGQGQVCMLGFVRASEAQRTTQARGVLTMETVGRGQCADD